jgi:hypothetical protein
LTVSELVAQPAGAVAGGVMVGEGAAVGVLTAGAAGLVLAAAALGLWVVEGVELPDDPQPATAAAQATAAMAVSRHAPRVRVQFPACAFTSPSLWPARGAVQAIITTTGG